MNKKKNAVIGTEKGSKTYGKGPMDPALLADIVALMASNDLNTVDVRDGDKRIIIRRGQVAPMILQQSSAVAPTVSPSTAPATPAAPADTKAKPAEETNYVAIKSPMVGTYYSSPSPDAKAFVNVGSVVSEDSDVCIIVAMKVYNNIKAECRGTIAKVLVNNGQTVEFGQTLFLVKP